VSGHIPHGTPPFDASKPSFFQPPADDRTEVKKSAAQTDGRAAARSPVTRAGFDAPVKQEQHAAPPQQSSTSLPAQATPNQASVAPPPLPLSRSNLATPISPAAESGEAEATAGGMPGMESLLTVAGSLGIVMGLFMVTMWCLRRGMPRSARTLPAEVVEVLGRAPLAGKQQMHLIRFGGKLVLAAVSPSGIDAVSEITDPVEADRLLGYCEQTRSSSATTSFRGILDRLDERSLRNADEHARRPHREHSALVAHKHARMEDEYA
jgi:flagellar biogenesis protein FliO